MASEARHDHKRKSQIGSGFFYSDLSASQFDPQMHSYEPNTELFNLQAAAGIEMLGPPQQHYSSHRDSNVRSSIPWRGFLDAKASSSKSIEPSGVASYYHHPEYQKPDFSTGFAGANVPNENNILIAPAETTWPQETRLLVEDSLRCVFPCDANQRPSQGLSLSLSPNKPSEIGLQSFELRETNHLQVPSNFRDGFLGKGSDFHHQFLQEGPSFLLKNSKYLVPAQELLNEFCNLGTKENGYADGWSKSAKHHKSSRWEEGVSSRTQSLLSFDFHELQKRKAKLISMLEEVDRKYRQYCEQMKAVVASFEEVAGSGSAAVYSSSASKAMSRHFRCLRDGIVSQIKATRKAMGEKDPVAAPGTTKGETPRLRLLDQTLRQQRAFQQMGVMESHPWRPQRGLPERSVSVLRAWLFEHFLHPYPSDVDKHILARQTGLSRSQVSNWFINARVRLWKPMVEEMYLEETKEQAEKQAVLEADASNYSGQQQEMIINGGRQDSINDDENPNPSTLHLVHPRDHLDNYQDHDQKPTPEQLVLHHDSDSLSSIINNNADHIRRLPLGGTKDQKQQPPPPPPPQEAPHQHQNEFEIRPESNFGVVVDLDFSSYSHENSAVTYAGNSDGTFGGGGGCGGGVSLTLGLQQHGDAAGVGLSSFSQGGGGAGPQPGSLFFPRQHMVEAECGQPMQYSLLDGEPQNLPYRNLMAAQLLHDLAG